MRLAKFNAMRVRYGAVWCGAVRVQRGFRFGFGAVLCGGAAVRVRRGGEGLVSVRLRLRVKCVAGAVWGAVRCGAMLYGCGFGVVYSE